MAKRTKISRTDMREETNQSDKEEEKMADNVEGMRAEEKKGADRLVQFFDAWMKTQKDIMETWIRSQKEFMDNWVEAAKKMQESFLNTGGAQEGTINENLNVYRSWLTTMANSSKVFTDQAGRIQDTWKNAVEKQMDVSREMTGHFAELFKKAA